jgi:hypothetical protein
MRGVTFYFLQHTRRRFAHDGFDWHPNFCAHVTETLGTSFEIFFALDVEREVVFFFREPADCVGCGTNRFDPIRIEWARDS